MVPTSGNIMNEVANQTKKFMDAVYAEGQKVHAGPIGGSQKSKRQQDIMWKKIQELDPTERMNALSDMATMSDHKGGDEPDNCSFCKFVQERVGK